MKNLPYFDSGCTTLFTARLQRIVWAAPQYLQNIYLGGVTLEMPHQTAEVAEEEKRRAPPKRCAYMINSHCSTIRETMVGQFCVGTGQDAGRLPFHSQLL